MIFRTDIPRFADSSSASSAAVDLVYAQLNRSSPTRPVIARMPAWCATWWPEHVLESQDVCTHDERPARQAMTLLKVAAYQAPLLPAGSMAALALIQTALVECERARVQILCCPEAILGGLADDHDAPREIALGVEDGGLARVLSPLCTAKVTLIVGFTEQGPNETWFNSAAVVDGGKVLGIYRKCHPAIRTSVYTAGTDLPIFIAHEVPFGIVICNDANYPELSRQYRDRGAAALFMPLNSRLRPQVADACRARTRQNLIERASQNGVPVISADVTGRDEGRMSYGATAIIAADGSVVAEAEPFVEGLIMDEIVIASR